MRKDYTFKSYSGGFGISDDYLKLHDFLVESQNTEYTYARLDWMITHRPYLEEEYLNKIGMWYDDNKMVAAVLFDTSLDDVFPVVLKGYELLYPQMIEYAENNMVKEKNPCFRIFVNDKNMQLQECVSKMRYRQTNDKEKVAFFDIKAGVPNSILPEGYHIVSFAEELEYEKYSKCLFKGFNHEISGEVFKFTSSDEEDHRMTFERDMVDLHLKLSVKSPENEYVAHCGMWYDNKSKFSVIEPVATIPQYRRMGFAKAVVFEGIRRTYQLGAEFAVVGSGQEFYYSIGMKPFSDGSFWSK